MGCCVLTFRGGGVIYPYEVTICLLVIRVADITFIVILMGPDLRYISMTKDFAASYYCYEVKNCYLVSRVRDRLHLFIGHLYWSSSNVGVAKSLKMDAKSLKMF